MFFKVKDDNKFVGWVRLTSNYIEEQQYDMWWERVEWKGLFNVQWLFAKNIRFDNLEDLEIEKFVDGIVLKPDVGFKLIKRFILTPYDFNDSIIQLFCILDKREDKLITLRSNITFKKDNNKHTKLRFY